MTETPPSTDARPSLAFPNAYVSTDEPPRRSKVKVALCVISIVGVAYLGVVILALSLLSTEYSPVTQFASDYGVGPFALEMNSGFLIAGVGVISLAVAGTMASGGRVQKAGFFLLLPSGLALVVNAFFQTDLEGAARTFHGSVHDAGGVIFFFAAPLGLLLIGRGFGRRRFFVTLAAFASAALLLALDGLLGLDAAGLVERVLILVVFSTAILTSIEVLKER